MAKLANSFATQNAIGNREELADKIYDISPEETPFISSIKRGKVSSVFPEWQTDALAAASNNKVVQGNEASINATTPTVRVGNRTQISEKTFAVTNTQEVVDKAGRKSEVAYQAARKMLELKRDMEFAALQNTTAISAADATAPQARGVAGWLGTNNNLASDGTAPNPITNTAPVDGTLRDFTEDMLKDIGQKVWTAGGNPTKLFVPAALRATVSGFTGVAEPMNDVRSKAATIVGTADIYVGDFGTYAIVNSRYSRARDVFLIDPEYWELGILRPMKATPLAVTGDNQKRLLNVEWTLKALNEASSGAIRDLQAA